METKGSMRSFGLIQISKNRYKVNPEQFNFSREDAKMIPGCYFSGVHKAWVFPVSEQNRRIFYKRISKKNRVQFVI